MAAGPCLALVLARTRSPLRRAGGDGLVAGAVRVPGNSSSSELRSVCYYNCLRANRWRLRLAGAERGSRLSQGLLNYRRRWVRATQHAPRDPFSVLESRHGLAEIVEHASVGFAERPRVIRPHHEREIMTITKNASRHGCRSA